MKNSFSETFDVPATAIDFNNHVNNVTYLQWCIEIAERHWISKTTLETREEYIWVVLKHTIEYKNPAFEGETLEISTWVNSATGVKSDRSYKIVRPKDGKVIIEANTIWCYINAKSHRPAKISEEIRNLFL